LCWIHSFSQIVIASATGFRFGANSHSAAGRAESHRSLRPFPQTSKRLGWLSSVHRSRKSLYDQIAGPLQCARQRRCNGDLDMAQQRATGSESSYRVLVPQQVIDKVEIDLKRELVTGEWRVVPPRAVTLWDQTSFRRFYRIIQRSEERTFSLSASRKNARARRHKRNVKRPLGRLPRRSPTEKLYRAIDLIVMPRRRKP
jgi:hypothetical protein